MNNKTTNKLSKFLSLVLRHSPETIGITLDENGWTDVIDLIDKMNKNGEKIKTTTSSGGLLFPYKGMVLACAEALQFGLPTA